MTQPTELLSEEAQYFHRALFHCEPDPEVVERYVAANQFCLPAIDPEALRIVETILSRRLDLEAVEAALRLRGKGEVVTKKVQILFYLIEVRCRYYGCFINERPRFWRACCALMLSLAWTVLKLGKGSFLIWRHGLV